MSEVFKELLATQNLPTPSNIALEIMRLSHSETATLNNIADLVEKDPALAGKILKYANTALFATSLPTISIRKAVVRLGTDIVIGLALGFSLLAKNREGRCANFDFPAFWSTSLAMAIAIRGLAEIRKRFDPDELFVCGLLSQVGRLSLASLYPREYDDLLATKPCETELLALETTEFGINHTEVSMELFRLWRLPKKYIEAIGFPAQGAAEVGDEYASEVSHLLRLARFMSLICMLELPLSEKIAAAEEAAEKSSISSEEFASLFDRIISQWQEWSLLFEIPSPKYSSFAYIKSIVNVEQNPEAANDREPFRILAVDDDPLSLGVLEALLAKTADTVMCAQDGEEALRLVIQFQPDLIITDWHMPGMSGIELCRILRKTESGKHIYIIMLTANESDDELVQAFEAGADDYVVKPFSPKALEARIRSGKRLSEYQEKMNRDQTIIRDYTNKLTAINKKLHTMAMTDALTGLPNRRSAMDRLQEMQAESKRFGNSISCIMIDIDKFKQINDTYGHECGDLILQELAQFFTKKCRGYDSISRIGGEEFLIISGRNSLQEAAVFAERLKNDVADNPIMIKGQTHWITISLGVAVLRPDTPEKDSLFHMADMALYNAKKKGRNRVEVADP